MASTALQKADVTGFRSNTFATVIYAGSTMWMLLLLGAQALALASQDQWSDVRPVLTALLVFNGVAYLCQTVDYVWFHFLLWPLTALNWTSQLSAIGCASSLIAFSLADDTPDRDSMIAMSIVHITTQTLFTASQFAVTLEYVERRLVANSTPPPPAVRSVRLVGRLGPRHAL